MVDTIEAKLDEIDAKIDQIAYAPKYKPSYEIGEMIKSKPAMGRIDTLIKGLTKNTANLTLSVTAGMLLTDVIKKATAQSKILGNLFDTVGKMLGLLIDLVLLPFLPLIVWAILNLYSAILLLTTPFQKMLETQGEAAGKAMATPAGLPIDIPTLVAGIAGAIVGGIVGALAGGPWGALIGGAVGALVSTILVGWAYKFGDFVGGIVYKAGKDFGAWVIGLGAGFMGWLLNLKKMWDTGWTKVIDSFNENFVKPFQNSINVIRNKFVDFINFIISKINDFLPPGMKINTTTSSTENKGMQTPMRGGLDNPTTVTNNFYGLQPEGLVSEVKNILRQFGLGWMI